MMMADLVIRDAAAVVTDWTQPPLLNAWLAVSDGRIEQVLQNSPEPDTCANALMERAIDLFARR